MSNKKQQKDFLDPNNDEHMYGIYQLKSESGLRDYRFTSIKALKEYGLTVKRDNYNLIYAAPMGNGDENLDGLYTTFNIDHPADFTGHSLSVSDIIVYKYSGNNFSAHYVDSYGFANMPDFMTESGKPPRKKSDMEM